MKKQNKKVLLVIFLFLSIITLSSFRDVSCWFGWCSSGDPIVQPTPENYTESGGSVANGRCVFYQPQTFMLLVSE